ncbi:MAG: class I adenylate-forming enzyme family protein [Nostocoides sp.]
MLVSDIVRENAKIFPEHEAIVTPEGLSRTWREVDERTTRLANAFLSLGMTKGDRIALFAPNCPEYVEFFFACAKSGVVGAPTNIRLAPYEIASYHGYVEPTAVIVHADVASTAAKWLPDVPSVKHVIGIGPEHDQPLDLEALIAAASSEDPDIDIEPDDTYQLGATSGTTGVPKAAILTHRNALASLTNWMTEMNVPQNGTSLQNIPFFFNPGGPAGLHPVLLKGGRTVITKAFDPAKVPALVERYRVTNTILVPTMVQMVVFHEGVENYDLSSLQGIMSGGSPYPVPTLRRAKQIFGDVLHPIYGMAESYSCGTILRREDMHTEGEKARYLGTIGRPFAFVQVRVVDEEGNDVPRDNATAGEIWMAGDVISPGYFRMDDETERSRSGKWLKTGDVATVDEDGFLTIVDRLKDMIITGGINVFSVEVERVIEAHPAVSQVAVIGVPHEQWGEAIHAVIVAKPGTTPTEEEILAFAAERLSGYKKPRSAQIIPEMPMSATGKILKKNLRSTIADS